ncbi:MAG: tRNA-dihydrouridine synthase family protein [Spirochaetes bacterium]|nr:tRNA-dihydrouridine synthase family protein [Spirochaetota bacterium]
MKDPQLYLAPLQGITNFIYRNLFHQYFGDIDTYFAPFILYRKAAETNFKKIKDLQPENNNTIRLIPQILSNQADDFLPTAVKLYQMGYSEINWNLGCPFPMVTRKKRGSGLLPYPDKIAELLETVVPQFPGKVSVKVRLGRHQKDELQALVPIFNQYPLCEMIIHPRLGIQMYEGTVNLEAFSEYLPQFKHAVVYNGDIFTYDDYLKLKKLFPDLNTWMIGRGAIRNPFLPWQIKNQTSAFPKDRYDIIKQFHKDLYHYYSNELAGSIHLLNKMKELWLYLSHSFENPQQVFHKIKRLKNIDQYDILIRDLFSQYQ